ncbi:unnamed protein product [Spirodela intermedia]|uniref:CBS domain-containing protein n=1 Tax=Spirodela intermedia TaxID=51605 RepID=A0A7I8JUH4_SPIIN|nr:unnamed protein product [Spirodela intermedia]CAA6673381.1 unnamed protein product [Spirodela intermedia]
MAVRFLAYEVSDLCIGKPPLKPLPLSATIGEALVCLKRCGESYLSVTCVGKVCMVDIICYLCSEENLKRSSSVALSSPVSVLLPKESGSLVRHVERHFSLLEALDLILDGAQNLVVPIRSVGRKKLHSNAADFCCLVQEDFVRFFLNSIGVFSQVSSLSVESLGIIRRDVLAVRYHEPALSALPLIKEALVYQTAVAVVTDDGKLVGEISPSTLASCDETVVAAIATLSAGELMAFAEEAGMEGMLELIEEEASLSSSASDTSLSTLSSGSSSSDEESTTPARTRRLEKHGGSGSYSVRMGRSLEEAIVSHPASSLVAVLIQALAHRVNYVWVVEDDFELAGLVTLTDILKIFRDPL